jgi:hypothetical protein
VWSSLRSADATPRVEGGGHAVDRRPRRGTASGSARGCRISRGRWRNRQRARGCDSDHLGCAPDQRRRRPHIGRPLENPTTNGRGRGLMRQPRSSAAACFARAPPCPRARDLATLHESTGLTSGRSAPPTGSTRGSAAARSLAAGDRCRAVGDRPDLDCPAPVLARPRGRARPLSARPWTTRSRARWRFAARPAGRSRSAPAATAGAAARASSASGSAILLWIGVLAISSGVRVSLVVQGVEHVQARGAPCGEDRREDAGEDRGEREHGERSAGDRERDAPVGERFGHERG